MAYDEMWATCLHDKDYCKAVEHLDCIANSFGFLRDVGGLAEDLEENDGKVLAIAFIRELSEKSLFDGRSEACVKLARDVLKKIPAEAYQDSLSLYIYSEIRSIVHNMHPTVMQQAAMVMFKYMECLTEEYPELTELMTDSSWWHMPMV